MIIFQSVFQHEVKGQHIVIELKNGTQIEGILEDVDANLNMLLSKVTVRGATGLPQTADIEEGFVRASAIAQVSLRPGADAARVVAATRAVYAEQLTEVVAPHRE